MAPRLLTFLGMIETALVNQGARAVAAPPQRSISFHKGMARMNFTDGSGCIVLQNFTLADGQICVKALFLAENGTQNGTHSIYPREGFDWISAADQVAVAWVASRPVPTAPPQVTTTEENVSNDAAASVIAAG
jgi:hypothetical protein